MSNTETICHSGIVKSADNQHIIVSIQSQAACVSCHAKGACSASDIQEKEIQISEWKGEFTPGERVDIISGESQGYRAVFWAYVFPLILLVAVLVVVLNATDNEGIAAIGALFVLAIYYFVLYLLRHKLTKSLKFVIRKSVIQNHYE